MPDRHTIVRALLRGALCLALLPFCFWIDWKDGRLADVVKYCEKDAIATLRLYLKTRCATRI